MKRASNIQFLAGFAIFISLTFTVVKADVNGSYTHKHLADIYDPSQGEWSTYETFDILVLEKINEQLLSFCFELYFTNGHQCVMQNKAKWVGHNRYEYMKQDAENEAAACRLHINLGNEVIGLEDIGDNCREIYCGARGVIEGVEFDRSSKVKQALECGFKY